MKFIKLMCLAVLSFALAGCQHLRPQSFDIVEQETQNIERYRRIAHVAAMNGAYAYLVSHPEERHRFEAAAASLRVLVSQDNGDPLVLRESLSGLPIKELRGEKAAILVANAELLLDELGVQHAINSAPRVQGFTNGLLQGLDQALALTAPTAQ